MASLRMRYLASPRRYIRSGSGTQVATRVIGTWFFNCALAAPDELGIDIFLDGCADIDEQLLEEVADFLWQYRRIAATAYEETDERTKVE